MEAEPSRYMIYRSAKTIYRASATMKLAERKELPAYIVQSYHTQNENMGVPSRLSLDERSKQDAFSAAMKKAGPVRRGAVRRGSAMGREQFPAWLIIVQTDIKALNVADIPVRTQYMYIATRMHEGRQSSLQEILRSFRQATSCYCCRVKKGGRSHNHHRLATAEERVGGGGGLKHARSRCLGC